MVHVVFVIAIFCCLPILNRNSSDFDRKFPLHICTFIILFLFLALRYDYGNDYMSYLYGHASMNSGIYAWGQSDILFRYLNILIPNFYIFIAAISFFYIITIYYLINKNLKRNQYWLAVLLLLINPYLFLIHLSSLRQTLAICCFIFAVNFAVKRKLKMYIAFTLVAIGMHASAIILLPLYFILTEKPFKKKWIFVIYGVLLALMTTSLFDIIAYKILEYLPANYMYYIEQGTQSSIISIIMSGVLFFIVIFNMGKLKGKEIIYGKLSLISTIVSLLAIRLSMISRIGMYFDIFMIITLTQILGNIDKKLYRKTLFVIIILIYILRYYSFFNNPLWQSYFEYNTIIGI